MSETKPVSGTSMTRSMCPTPGLCSTLLLLLLASHLGGEAAPTPQKFRISGRGRAGPSETVTLSCQFLWRSTASPSSYEWTKNGEVIPGETRGTLTFSPVTTQDTGIYQCGDPNSSLERLEHDLYVTGARLPRPEVHVLGVEVLGRSFSMECVVMKGYAHNNKTVYTWYKNGTEIPGQSSRVLRFSTVREADAGMYTCTVREGAEETTSPRASPSYHLLPLVSPELRIKPTSADHVTKGVLGENLTLTCEVTQAFPRVPADGYSWSYLPSPKGLGRPLEGTASTLTLGPLTREDGGQYVCQARNDQIFPQHKNLNLTGHASVIVYIVYLENITLTSDLEVKKVKKGDTVTLTCSVDSQPAARLAWTVHGQEVRHVTDNLDRYVILHADCSDSTNYTCRASNPDLPGREVSATIRLHVQSCDTGPATSDNTTAEISATFDFRLPDETFLVVVVHPRGQDILTVQPDCSFNISAAFFSRLLHPRFDPAQRHLSFTLAKVTKEDEGNYIIMEEGGKGRTPRLAQELRLERAVQDETPPDQSHSWPRSSVAVASVLACLILGTATFLVIKYRRHIHLLSARWRRRAGSAPPGDNISREDATQTTPLMQTQGFEQEAKSTDIAGGSGLRRRKVKKEPAAPSQPQQKSKSGNRRLPLPQGGVEDFEVLYRNGEVYVIPPLPDIPPQQPPLVGGQADLDSGEDRQGQEGEEAKVCVLRLLCDLLKKLTCPSDPPVFVFTQALPCYMHAIIYHSKLGVIIVTTRAVSNSSSSSILTKAAKELEKARDKVKSQLGGLLGPEAVTLLLALPNLENKEDVKETVQKRQFNPDIQLLFGRKEADFEAWLQKLFKRQDHPERVWRRRPNSHQAFVTAVSKYLCLEGPSRSQREGRHIRLLATPEQAAVLCCADKWLHIWGSPGSGKTLLVLDRVRRWLKRGKTVVVAVCTPHFQLLLHRLGEESLRGLNTKIINRLTFCCDPGLLQKTLRKLGQQLPTSSVCVFIDNLDSQMHSVLLEASRSTVVECVWTTGQRDLQGPASTQLQSLGGRVVRLSLPLQYHPALLPLARELLPPGPLTPDLTDPPCLPARLPPASVKVTLHPSHPDYKVLEQDSSAFDCGACSQWLTSSLSPLVEGLPLEDKRWRRWVILLTGVWGSGSQVMMKLVTWLRHQGVPAVQEWKPDGQISCLPVSSLLDPSPDQKSEVIKDGTALRARVLSGVDRERRPAVHMIPVSMFTGLEKAGVLAVHYDWRDDHPDHQSQEERNSRLSKHGDQLFHAVTRCQTELAVWLLSPSPAASLLQGHVEEGQEEQSAGIPEATGAAEQSVRLAHKADKLPRHQD